MTKPNHSESAPQSQAPRTNDAILKMGRRRFVAAVTAAATAGISQQLFARDYGPGAPPQRYPDPDIVELDERFAKYKLGNS